MIRILKALGAAIALLFLMVAPPAFLILAIGNPWPAEGISLTAPLTDHAIMGVIAVALWIVWAQMMLSFMVEAYAAISDRAVDVRLPVLGVQQDLARALIGAILTSTVAAAPIGAGLATHDAAAQTSPQATPTSSQADQDQVSDQQLPLTSPDRGPDADADRGSSASRADSDRASASARATGITVTVQRGDTLWSLAEQYLGDGDRWTEIASANRDQTMVDGAQFTSANSIRPGWHLTIPGVQPEADARADAGSAAAPGEGTYQQVVAGDTLWGISEEQLGDGARYPEIYEASQEITQPGGGRLTDPGHIEPGWIVAVRGTRVDARTPRLDGGGSGETDSGDTSRGRDALQPAPDAESRSPRPSPQSAETDAGSRSAGSGRGEDAEDAAQGPGERETVLEASWVLSGLTGGGVLLAGALYVGLQRRRRVKLRARRPGRATAPPPPDLAPTEMTINAAGGPAAATVTFMDEALRRLAEHARTHEVAPPPLEAVQLRGDLVTLHLRGPADLPPPWHGSPDRLHWSCSSTTAVEDLGPDHGWAEAPYPMLVTIGVDDRVHLRTDRGDLWLLNCEELGTLEVVGAPSRVGDFVRHLAAQLAVNPWSQQVKVDCVGIAGETEPLGDRIRYHDTGWEGDRATSEVLAGAVSMVDRTASHDTNVRTGRTGALDDDVWPAQMLMVTSELSSGSDGSEQRATNSGQPLLELRNLLATHVDRTGTAILIVGAATGAVVEGPEDLCTTVRLTSDGRVLLDQHGLDLAAVGLTSEETRGCALLYAQSEVLDDVEMPVDEEATEGWEALVDQTGALRRELTLPRSTPDDEIDEPTASLLAGPNEEYVAVAAATPEDLEAVAPRIPESVLTRVKAEDPMLDDDLRDWFDPDSPRAKLTLLGPVAVRTHGRPLAKYKALCTEIIAYLALRPRNGATRDELAEAMGWDDPARVRKYIDLARHWLGADPETHEQYLPHASKSPAAKIRGVNVYQVTVTPGAGLLCDWDLFRRLRARGTHSDLLQALELVTGRPFEQHRQGGWSWLYKGEPHDQYAAHAIADVAFTVVTHCLHEGDLSRTRAATEVAILAVPDDQVVQLCQVALTEAEGNNTEAMRLLLEDVCNRSEDGDGPLDLPQRTQEIIRNHQWMAS